MGLIFWLNYLLFYLFFLISFRNSIVNFIREIGFSYISSLKSNNLLIKYLFSVIRLKIVIIIIEVMGSKKDEKNSELIGTKNNNN